MTPGYEVDGSSVVEPGSEFTDAGPRTGSASIRVDPAMDRAIKGWHWCEDLRGCDDAPMRSILVVDDYEPFRVVVRQMLERDGFQVVGEAADGTAAIDAAWRLRPEVILLTSICRARTVSPSASDCRMSRPFLRWS